jgi:hypothetical protein
MITRGRLPAAPLWLCAAILLAPVASAGEEAAVDRMEQLFGATRINAALGHGRLTVGVSHAGELTVLRWPNPSFYEHLNYATAGGENPRAKPLFGAQPNEGSFAGLALRSGQTITVTWLRDPEWTQEQAYLSETADTLRTRYRSDALALTVEGVDVIDPGRDALARRYRVTPDAGAGYDAIALLYFENLAPNVEKDPFVPVTAQTKDTDRDYALVYDPAHDALLHGSVEGRPVDVLAKLPAPADAAAVTAFLDALSGRRGTFIAIGGSSKASGFQCGVDAVDGDPAANDPAANDPEDAFDDAADGALSGSRAATRHATGALSFDLGAAGGEATVFVAAAGTADEAWAALAGARQAGFDDIAQASAKAWSTWLEGAQLPDTTDADRLRIARRALITIRTATATDTGAVVASIATQPAYALDWPRDGAFINLALDAAGKHDTVTVHNETYAGWQRQKDGQDVIGGGRAPAGSYAMNYYADGVPGGFIPFEIDQVGLALWSFYSHATFLADRTERDAYLDAVWPALERAADLLASCADEATRLQCAANEDDDIEQSISLHGAVATVLGLRSAIRAARYLGRREQASRWLARLRELEQAVEEYLYLEGAGYSGIVPGQRTELWPPWRRTGALAWAVWPGQLGPHDSPQMQQTADVVRGRLEPFFTKAEAGGAYHAKGTLALAMHYSSAEVDDPAGRETVRRWIDVLVKEVPTPGTSHFGEAYIHTDVDGDGKQEYANRVSIPHVWEASLVYLSLMAAYSPARLRPPHLAEIEEPEEGCRVNGPPTPGVAAGPFAVVALLLAAAARRRLRG